MLHKIHNSTDHFVEIWDTGNCLAQDAKTLKQWTAESDAFILMGLPDLTQSIELLKTLDNMGLFGDKPGILFVKEPLEGHATQAQTLLLPDWARERRWRCFRGKIGLEAEALADILKMFLPETQANGMIW